MLTQGDAWRLLRQPGQRSDFGAPQREPGIEAGDCMAVEDYAHVFVLRIWREPREIVDAPPQWRGFIEDATRGRRRYLTRLDDIPAFIAPYLREMGVDPNPRQPWRQRWRRLFR